MIRHRSGGPTKSRPESSLEEEDEDDAFSALSRRAGSKRAKTGDGTGPGAAATPAATAGVQHEHNHKRYYNSEDPSASVPLLPTTSSMKRHHALSDTRKARMDVVLMELEAEKRLYASGSSSGNSRSQQRQHREGNASSSLNKYIPDKRGSFVEPGEEHLTTNLFVGNLAPSITEEQLTDLFRQFGELYSVKIMWARTVEERTRNRHTGFVCFMNRRDAEDAMEACNDSDPFNVGRRIVISWGKNVKKTPIIAGEGVSASAGGGVGAAVAMAAPIPMVRRPAGAVEVGPTAPVVGARLVTIDDLERGRYKTIRVQVPPDPRRAAFIATVASFVAKDGHELERKILDREYNNSVFSFLWPDDRAERATKPRQEHIFYKWRVYAFCNGDSFHTWRTEPFVMLEPFGCIWIPPPLDVEAARREAEEAKLKEEAIRQQKLQRTFQHVRRDYMTGRRLEQAKKKGGAEGTAELSSDESAEFERLFRRRLCCSRDSICQAMAFCFEKSAAALHISALLKDLLMERGAHISVETRIARLYLLSDVLFNSQQIGVRNAFRYRDEIQRMLPQVFGSLAEDPGRLVGRMTHNKLASAVSSVLGAWTNWSVYSPAFLDELHARFEGREVIAEDKQVAEGAKEEHIEDSQPTNESDAVEPISTTPKGDWTVVDPDPVGEGLFENAWDTLYQNPTVTTGKEIGCGVVDEDPDGQPLADEDGEPLVEGDAVDEQDKTIGCVDWTPLDDDVDGEPIRGDVGLDDEPMEGANGPDFDGGPLDDDKVDGDPIEEDADPDGVALGDNDDVKPIEDGTGTGTVRSIVEGRPL